MAGRATAPTTGSPSTARATWTAQSSRPSEYSRVPSSGSMIHTRPDCGPECLGLVGLLRSDPVGGEPVVQPGHEQPV